MPRKTSRRNLQNKKQTQYTFHFLIQEVWKPFAVVTYSFLLIIISFVFLRSIPFSIFQSSKNNIFQVKGTGKIIEFPNSVKFSFEITKSAATVTDSQKQTQDTVSIILSGIKTASAAAKDITIINYIVYPTFEDGKQIPNGYTVTQDIELKISPISNINHVLDFITANGVSQINGISFTFDTETQKKLEEKARQQAISNAKRKAQQLASAAGIHLGRIIDIQEIPQQQFLPLQQPTTQQALDVLNGTSPVPTPQIVQMGNNVVTVTIVLSYETF